METKIYDVLRKHKLSLKKREAIIQDLLPLMDNNSDDQSVHNLKIGDVVEVTQNYTGHGFKIGQAVSITHIGVFSFICTNGVHRYYLTKTEIKKI